MLDKNEIVDWLYVNCKDVNDNLILNNLDLTRFNNVYFNNNKIKGDLCQKYQEVEGNLHQGSQVVGGSLYQGYQTVNKHLRQHHQKVNGDLSQFCQEVGGDLYQNEHLVEGDLFQNDQNVEGDLFSHKLKENEYWEVKSDTVVRKKVLKKITLEELESMEYELEEDEKC